MSPALDAGNNERQILRPGRGMLPGGACVFYSGCSILLPEGIPDAERMYFRKRLGSRPALCESGSIRTRNSRISA